MVAESRRPKKPKTSQLDAHRAELLKIRREGAPLRAICDGLGKLGVVVSEEALRLWFKAHTRRSPKTEARRLAATAAALAAIQAEAVVSPLSPTAAGAKPAGLPITANLESRTTAPPAATVMAEPGKPASMHVAAIVPAGRPSSLILPGETPSQALRRRLAVLDAERAAKGGGTN